MTHSPTRDPQPLPSLHYLTVQDILWINQTLSKKVYAFDYAKLEEAVFYQYAYGASSSLVPQAGRFLEGFAKLRPLAGANEATCFVACASFLLMNGMGLRLGDAEAAAWFDRVAGGKMAGGEAIAQLASPDESVHSHLVQNVRGSVEAVLARYPKTIQQLLLDYNKIRRAED